MKINPKQKNDLKQEYSSLCQKRQDLFYKLSKEGMIGQALWNEEKMKELNSACDKIGDEWRSS